MDGLRVVILSFVEKWLCVTVVCTGINEHLVQSFCPFHAEEKIDGSLHCTSIFAAAHRFWVVLVCIERFQSTHAKSDGRQLPAGLL